MKRRYVGYSSYKNREKGIKKMIDKGWQVEHLYKCVPSDRRYMAIYIQPSEEDEEDEE